MAHLATALTVQAEQQAIGARDVLRGLRPHTTQLHLKSRTPALSIGSLYPVHRNLPARATPSPNPPRLQDQGGGESALGASRHECTVMTVTDRGDDRGVRTLANWAW